MTSKEHCLKHLARAIKSLKDGKIPARTRTYLAAAAYWLSEIQVKE